MLASEWLARVAASYDKQLHLHDVVGALDWQFDLGSGLLSFGTQYQWRTQLLGTESEATGTWLWTWANSASHIPEHLLQAGHALKSFGEQHGIPELTQPEVPLGAWNGHTFSLLASGIGPADAYYRCPFEGGALFVLIRGDAFPKCPDPPLVRVVSVFPRVLAAFEILDHRLALSGYLDHYGLGYTFEGGALVVRENGEPVFTATFDEYNRLTHLDAELSAEREQPVESWDEMQLRLMMRR